MRVLAGLLTAALAAPPRPAAPTALRFGHAWDGARLAGQAALSASDPAVASDLLQVARSLAPVPAGAPSGGPAERAPGAVRRTAEVGDAVAARVGR